MSYLEPEDPLLSEEEHRKRHPHPHNHGFFTIRNFIIAGVVVVIGIVVVVSVMFAHKEIDPIDRLLPGSYKVAGVDVYVVGTSNLVILIMPDIYGMSVEVKQIADFYSQGDFTVVVVDYFNGDPRTNMSDPTWNDRHPANKSLALANGVIANVKDRGYTNLQVQGYCYGGRTGVSLTFINNTAPPHIRSAVVAHPASLNQNDASLILTPIFFVMPAVDGFNSLAPYFNTTLTQRKIVSEFKIYPNTTHGFAVSATINPTQKQIAMKDSLAWFQKYARGELRSVSA